MTDSYNLLEKNLDSEIAEKMNTKKTISRSFISSPIDLTWKELVIKAKIKEPKTLPNGKKVNVET